MRIALSSEAREHLDEKLKSDSQFHQQQLIAERQERHNLENTLQRELDEARTRLASLTGLEKQRDSETAARTKAEDDVKATRAKLAEVQVSGHDSYFSFSIIFVS